MVLDGESVAFILLAVAILVLLGGFLYLFTKVTALLAGGLGKNLPETLQKLGEKVTHGEQFEEETISFLKELNRRVRRSTQGIGVVRFNAFKEGGSGGQSFATTIINEEGNGIVISSIYGRDRVGIYSKPIEKFTSSFELSEEEKESIKEAKTKLGR